MRLAVVVPVLNEAAGIEAGLRALAPFRAAGDRIVVVDGGSTDGTAARAAPLCDAIVVATGGRGPSMNAGAAAASADAYLFLHSDTFLDPGAREAIVAALGAGALWGRFDIRILGRHPMLRVVGAMMNLRSRLTGIATGDQAIFVTDGAFRAVGGFQPIPLMEDIALSAALKRLGRPACLSLRASTSGRRWETRGVFRTILLMWRLRFAYWRGAEPNDLAERYRRG